MQYFFFQCAHVDKRILIMKFNMVLSEYLIIVVQVIYNKLPRCFADDIMIEIVQ